MQVVLYFHKLVVVVVLSFNEDIWLNACGKICSKVLFYYFLVNVMTKQMSSVSFNIIWFLCFLCAMLTLAGLCPHFTVQYIVYLNV